MKLPAVFQNRPYILVALAIFVVTFVVYYFTGEGKPTPYHYFVPLADAFLHGRLYLLEGPNWLNELLEINGKYFVIYPPVPALLLLPQVALHGWEANQTLASVFWASLSVAIVYLTMRRVVKHKALPIWIAVMFGLGSIYWYLASVGKAWFFAQVSSFLFLILAVFETYGKRRPLLIGLLIGASFWSRLPTVLSMPFFLIMLSDLWYRGDEQSLIKRIRLSPLIKLGVGVGIFILMNFLYNYLRFDTFSDIAYEIQSKREPWWYPKGLFHISYVPQHLWVFFLKPPIFLREYPYVQPSFMGMSILFTTPAFIYSVFAGIRNKQALACWAAIVPIALVAFLHGGTGWMMFGYRYAVDFYPFLLVLTALGIEKSIKGSDSIRWDIKALIIFGILVNLWGVIMINKLGYVSLWD